MARSIPLSTLVPRLLVVALVLLALMAAFKWGQYSRLSQIRSQSSRFAAQLPVKDNSGEAHESTVNSSEPWIEVVSWSPRIFVYHHFIPLEDCDHIIRIGEAQVTKSLVVGATGNSVAHEARSSSGVFLTGQMASDPAVKRLQERIADWTQIPESHGEPYYLIRYEVGQQYKPHFDYFSNDANGAPFIGNAGNRMATVLSYLSTPEEGGETIFPEVNKAVKATKGDAVLFFSMLPDGNVDPKSLHGGNPVIKGTKWAMTKWIREKPF